MYGRGKETRLKDGTELRTALAAACENAGPNSFSLKDLNELLQYVSRHKDERDPLELKHILASKGSGLDQLTFKQRKKAHTWIHPCTIYATIHSLSLTPVIFPFRL